ncbi:FAD-binding protein [Micromonospora cathayae]|uniref:FAD-binding protein n=1 Tax=Micromonospora cathayae TaxID=3028804 RepID=A0ABY7ZLN9_9ACTN|nr:FAD-binding protein [Micromonospora sp. HUAS 3]WDZ83807.1 FAD-binding protein [Micromonospora sp. HUAS 3]
MRWDEEYDLVCVGGGIGGLAGAIRGHHLGLSTVVLEKSPWLGGVASYSGGNCFLPGTALARDAGYHDDPDDAERYLSWVAGDGVAIDRRLLRAFLAAVPEAVAFFHDTARVPFRVIAYLPDHYYPAGPGSRPGGRLFEVAVDEATLGEWAAACWPSPHFPFEEGASRNDLYEGGDRVFHPDQPPAGRLRTFGPGLVAGFVRAACVDRNIPVHRRTRVRELVQATDGTILGVRADGPDGLRTLRARRGVLLATGSYGNAPDVARTEGLPELIECSPPVLDGDHLTLTDPTRAALIRAGEAFTALGFHTPGETHPGSDVPLYRQAFASIGFPHSMVVNRRGERFGDESHISYLVNAIKAFDVGERRFRNHPCFLVVDDRFRQRYPLGPFPPGAAWPADLPHADDLGSLADLLGVDRALVDTVAAFNAHARAGRDPEFGRGDFPHARIVNGDPAYPNPNLGPIEQPPFWGIRLSLLGVGIYSLGLAIDPQARALTRAGEPVPGLYATGNAVAHAELPRYHGGFANARNIVYAYLAAGHAARRADPVTTLG